eukprot:CAMPEP_0202913552 /NCGR_PEP_ID=MMETSP1392-20130828/60806_1 /ASSEMBLY_ACC=CAM_ASM_000868 /TAXON_ID=225041 /ORGANISM="Chlamydomonas chlamydogama, Strain SAG 11-48b" /LENGTH=57 /DNA_ID=CAMNT_0049604849 /DNA_START=27 /DNA_END=200 /DNA_ORIENTATION=-
MTTHTAAKQPNQAQACLYPCPNMLAIWALVTSPSKRAYATLHHASMSCNTNKLQPCN